MQIVNSDGLEEMLTILNKAVKRKIPVIIGS
jgi:hypothetical protein